MESYVSGTPLGAIGQLYAGARQAAARALTNQSTYIKGQEAVTLGAPQDTSQLK